MEKSYIGAIDQGTTSTRFILFDQAGREIASSQREHRQYFPRPGWVEHDPEEIWLRTGDVIRDTLKKSGVQGEQIAALGITNQRETSLVWDAETGRPLYNAIVWQDTRTTAIIERLNASHRMLTERTGLPPATYFSASKLTWLIENVPEIASSMERGSARFGTIDSWLIWKLTGQAIHATDVTNASRTLLMNIRSCEWDTELLDIWQVPSSCLPRICSRRSVPSLSESPRRTVLWGRRFPSAAFSGISRRPSSGRPVSNGAVRRIPTVPAVFCC